MSLYLSIISETGFKQALTAANMLKLLVYFSSTQKPEQTGESGGVPIRGTGGEQKYILREIYLFLFDMMCVYFKFHIFHDIILKS